MRRSFQSAVTALLCGSLTAVSVAATGCGGDDSTGINPPLPPSDSGADTGGQVMIHAVDNSFDPPSVTIALGTTVEWMNAGMVTHTATSGQSSSSADLGKEFDHQLAPGQTFSHTFQVAGEFPYFCRLHESLGMKGTIIVSP